MFEDSKYRQQKRVINENVNGRCKENTKREENDKQVFAKVPNNTHRFFDDSPDTPYCSPETLRKSKILKEKQEQDKKAFKKGMSYSQKKRASFNYRYEYFKKNPGIFGNIWFCSQCGKILVGKHNVCVDHIVPLNSVAGVNKTFNTVAICRKCNSSKSDTIDYRVAKGYLAKVFEVLTSYLPDALALLVSLIISIVYRILNVILTVLTIPFTVGNGRFFVCFIALFFILFIFYNKIN